MAEMAGVNVNTVRTVYARLEQEGLLVSEHGRGTFVGGASSESRASDREYRRELLRQIVELERQAAYYTRHRTSERPSRRLTGRPASSCRRPSSWRCAMRWRRTWNACGTTRRTASAHRR